MLKSSLSELSSAPIESYCSAIILALDLNRISLERKDQLASRERE